MGEPSCDGRRKSGAGEPTSGTGPADGPLNANIAIAPATRTKTTSASFITISIVRSFVCGTILALARVAAQQPVSAQLPRVDADHPPRFEEFPVHEVWNGPATPPKLITRSERMFRTQLTDAAKESPNFAGHYRFAFWGCGSLCTAAAVVDLRTGAVSAPPLGAHGGGWMRRMMSPAFFEGSAVEHRVDSRLVIIRAGINYSETLKANVPDVYYFVWEGHRFRQLLFM